MRKRDRIRRARAAIRALGSDEERALVAVVALEGIRRRFLGGAEPAESARSAAVWAREALRTSRRSPK